jgi:hypothetical protein
MAREFEKALKRLIEDRLYREAVIRQPTRLVDDYNLDTEQLRLMVQLWRGPDNREATASRGAGAVACCCCCLVSESQIGGLMTG